MSSKRVSVAGVARHQKAEDRRTRDALSKASGTKSVSVPTSDSFVNFSQKLGVGADNPLSTASYGFNPITRIRTMLEWIHRGSWLGGMAVDLVADDMTRAGVELLGELDPKQSREIEVEAVRLKVWTGLRSTIKWARLYGGALGVIMIKGQDYSTPLRIETVGKDQFRGVLPLDRWMVDPSLNDLEREEGPSIGMPKFYSVYGDAPALRGHKIHHTRCVRLIGIELPYYQKLLENFWGISVLERLYDRMIAFDSATTGAAQLVYKAYIRTYKVKDLRSIIASGGKPMEGLVAYVEMMRRFQGIEGITLLDAEDEMEAMAHTAFSGIADTLLQFGQQLSGALQIPLVRLFGQSPAGLSATGESDLRMYYDGINQQQNSMLLEDVTKLYRAIAQSKGIKLPEDFGVAFKNLWQLQDKEKAEIAEIDSRAIAGAEDSGLISQQTALKELKQSSKVTGRFTNITQKDIEAAAEDLPPAGEEAAAMEQEQALALKSAGPQLEPGAGGEGDDTPPEAQKKPSKSAGGAKDDSLTAVLGMAQAHGLNVIIEHEKGQHRRGMDEATGQPWNAILAADYGYISNTVGADTQQVDCFVGPNPASDLVWVISQVDPVSKVFDEHKCLLGFSSMVDALGAYVASYSDALGLERIGAVISGRMPEFKAWLSTYSKAPGKL